MAQIKLTCTADVSISEQYSAKAYTTADRLAFGRGAASGDRYWALLKFQTLKLDAALYEITKAVLTVKKISGAVGFQADMNARALRVTSAWSETTAWETKPSTTSEGQSAVTAMGEGHSGSVSLDVTDIVLAWQGGSAQYGLCLQQSDSTASRLKCIADRTASGAASITVTYTEKKSAPTTPVVTVPGTITADSHSFKWSASGDHIFTSGQLSYQLQVSLDGGASWSSSYTAAAGKTSLSVNLRTLAGLKAGQYYHNTGLKVRVRAVTPAYNGAVYYSGWGTSAAGTINYKITPGKPSGLTLSTSAPYEGQGVTVTMGRPAVCNSYDAAGREMPLTYHVKFSDGSLLGSVTAAASEDAAVLSVNMPAKTSGKADLTTTLTAFVTDGQGQTGAATAAAAMTIKRYRDPALTIARITREAASAAVVVSVSDTGYGATQGSAQIAKVEYRLAGGSWVTVTPAWSGLKASFTLPGLDAASRYTLEVRLTNTTPGTLAAKTATASGTVLEHTPAAMIFRDSSNQATGVAAKSLIVGDDWSLPMTDGRLMVSGSMSVGPKTSGNDGKNGVSMGQSGYLLMQRSDGGSPYIALYTGEATSPGGHLQLNSGSGYMEFRYAGRYTFDKDLQALRYYCSANATTGTGILAIFADNTTHALIERASDGLTSYFGWAGSGSYKTVSVLRGQTCKYQNSSGTTTLSDERLKKDFVDLTNWEKFYDQLRPVAFRMKNGASGRYHMGFKAQQVKAALEEGGLSARDFAGFVEMPHSADEEDPQGEAVYEAAGIRDGDTEMGLIYTEFVALNTHMIQKLRAEVAQLKEEVAQLKQELGRTQ